MLDNPRVKEAPLYEKINGEVRCLTCARYCEIKDDGLGFCGTRKNINGKLYTLIYGDISLMEAHPIEHKPLFHFYPGTQVLTVSSWSCNFECGWCFRKYLSKAKERVGKGRFLSPEEMPGLIRQNNCQGIAISFNEPTLLLEWCLDVFPLTKREGYYNAFVTNGYMSKEALRLLAKHGLEAMNIDIKGNEEIVREHCGGEVGKVWENAVEAKKLGIWVEITTLIVPGVTDREECLRPIATRIKKELGEDTPWHVNAYLPRDEFAFRAYGPAASLNSIAIAREIGKKEGLNYVYAGGYHAPYQNTYCPFCNELLIERYGFGFDFFQNKMDKDNKCPQCKEIIPIISS